MNKNNNIFKEFLEFGRGDQLTGKVIATEIIQVSEKPNIDKKCRGQGYDNKLSCYLKQ